MENLLYFKCKVNSGHVVEGLSRVPARKIKYTLEFYRRKLISIGEYRDAEKKDIEKIGKEFGIENLTKSGILEAMKNDYGDILTIGGD